MGLYKRDDIYYIRVNNRRISTQTKNRKLALWIYRNVLKEVVYSKLDLSDRRVISKSDINRKEPVKTEKKEIAGVYKDYIATCELKKFAKHTITFKNLTLKLLINNGIKYFDEINQNNLNRFFKALAKYSDDTKRKFICELRAFLNNCIKKGLFTKVEYDKMDYPVYKVKPRDLIFTDEDLQKIFDFVKERNKDFYFYLLTLYNTLSRPNEITIIETTAFDFENNTALIYQSKTKKNKKVYLKPSFVEEFSAYITKNKIKGKIFKGAFDERSAEYYGKMFVRTRKYLNLNEKYTLYTYRHTSITNLLNATNDIDFVSKQAGNNPEVALKHYVNRNDKHYKNLMEKLE